MLNKDDFRHAIFKSEEIEYSTPQDDFCQELMLQMAGDLLSRDPAKIIFLDGRPFSRRYQIENAIAAAASLHQPWHILECICAEETVKARLEADARESRHPACNRTFQLYLDVKTRFETIVHPKAVIDTSQPLAECVEKALAILRAAHS